jgi:hypothetical protein
VGRDYKDVQTPGSAGGGAKQGCSVLSQHQLARHTNKHVSACIVNLWHTSQRSKSSKFGRSLDSILVDVCWAHRRRHAEQPHTLAWPFGVECRALVGRTYEPCVLLLSKTIQQGWSPFTSCSISQQHLQALSFCGVVGASDHSSSRDSPSLHGLTFNAHLDIIDTTVVPHCTAAHRPPVC